MNKKELEAFTKWFLAKFLEKKGFSEIEIAEILSDSEKSEKEKFKT